MTDFSDNPFQMDEDLGSQTPPESTVSSHKIQASPSPLKHTSDSQQVPDDTKLLRSRLRVIRFEENAGTTTEEDEIFFEEDVDDKFDGFAVDDRSGAEPRTEVTQQRYTLTPPENFAPVINKIYRSSFPQAANFTFLKKLNLASVLCLIPEDYPQTHLDFFEQEGIRLFQLGMSGNKEPFVEISSDLITTALKIVLNPANHPILIHCNRGKHRTGCLVGVLRRLQGWSLTMIFDEYRKFAAPKERPMDQQFIELYDTTSVIEFASKKGLLPIAWE